MKTLLAAAAVAGATLATGTANAQSIGYVGEVRAFGFDFCPRNWTPANGALLSIADHSTLYALYGTQYGGDGRVSFAVPDLTGRAPVHIGQGPGMINWVAGQKAGVEEVATIPPHTHEFRGSSDGGTSNAPTGGALATFPVPGYAATSETPVLALNSASIEPNAPPGLTEDNLMPTLAVTYCVALDGVFPPRS
ncbi:MAG: tail fiber protein [Pseudomonadota bacterium]